MTTMLGFEPSSLGYKVCSGKCCQIVNVSEFLMTMTQSLPISSTSKLGTDVSKYMHTRVVTTYYEISLMLTAGSFPVFDGTK
jgi:hypothetical protein